MSEPSPNPKPDHSDVADCHISTITTSMNAVGAEDEQLPSLGYGIKATSANQISIDPGKPYEEAQTELYNLLNGEIFTAVRNKESIVFDVAASVGIGKTTITAQMIVQKILHNPQDDTRVLWLAPTKAVRTETVKQHFTDDKTGVIYPGVAICYARSADPDDPGYCRRYQRAEVIGSKRQSIAVSLCRYCNIKTSCKYLQQRQDARTAKVVVATHEAYLHNGTDIDHFNLVVIDESVTDALIEDSVIKLEDIIRWEGRMIEGAVLFAQANFISTLKQVCIRGLSEGQRNSSLGIPLLPVLCSINPRIRSAINALYDSIKNPILPEQRRMHGIDRAAAEEIVADDHLPLFGFIDLITTLSEEIETEAAINTACWLIPAQKGQVGHTHLITLRNELIERLRNRVTLLLNATPPRRLLQCLFEGQIVERNIRAETYQHVTLFTDSLYNPEHIKEGSWNKSAVEHMLSIWCNRYKKPLVVYRKKMKDFAIPKNAERFHFGSDTAFGSNVYFDCDAIILIGHYRTPDYVYIRLVSALRSHRTSMDEREAQVNKKSKKYDIPIPGYQLPDGRRLVRETYYPADLDAFLIEREEFIGNIIQTIGRARPSDPNRKGNPLPVMLLIGEPPGDFQVDDLTTLPNWLAKEDPAWLDNHPEPPDRNPTEKMLRNLTNANDEKSDDSSRLLDKVVALMQRKGWVINPYTLSKEASVHYNTAKKYLRNRRAAEES